MAAIIVIVRMPAPLADTHLMHAWINKEWDLGPTQDVRVYMS